MATSSHLPIWLDGFVAGPAAAVAGLSPLVGLAAMAIGGALYLVAARDAHVASAARRAGGAALGGLSALGLAQALAAAVAPLTAGV